MRRSLIAGNWKMNGSQEANALLLTALAKEFSTTDQVDIIVAAPAIFLDQVNRLLESSTIALAAQNVSEFEAGAYTGEISANMLVDLGCAYVIVGHSERRQMFHESDQIVAKKFEAAQSKGMTPILCIGETKEQRDSGSTEEVVLSQLRSVIKSMGVSALARAVVAYEPIWAIGTGETASPEQAQQVHALLRAEIAGHNQQIAEEQRIIYGGSVNATNASALFEQEDIDGALVGGASLDAQEFINICKVVC